MTVTIYKAVFRKTVCQWNAVSGYGGGISVKRPAYQAEKVKFIRATNWEESDMGYFKKIIYSRVTEDGEIVLHAMVNGKSKPDTFILYACKETEEMQMDYCPAEFDQ